MTNTTLATPSPKQRIILLDYARVFTAYLVILGHMLPMTSTPRAFIYQFHMPLFFLISGMLDKPIGFKESLKKNSRLLLIPVVSFLLIFFIYRILHNDFSTACDYMIKSVFAFIYGKRMIINGPLWFLIVLFNIKIFVCLFRKISIYITIAFWSILFIITLYYNYFYIGQTVMALPFFIVGMMFKQKILSLSKTSIFKYLWPIGFIIVLLFMTLNGKISMLGLFYGKYPNFPISVIMFFTSAFIGTFAVLSFSCLFTKNFPLLKTMADSLLTMVCIQNLFIAFWNTICPIEGELFKIIGAIVVMILCVFAHIIINKYCPFILGKFPRA